MLTLFLVFIITKGALTLYEGNTIEGRAVRGGDTAQSKYSVQIGILEYHDTMTPCGHDTITSFFFPLVP